MDLPHAQPRDLSRLDPASPCVRGCLQVLERCETVLDALAAARVPGAIERIGPHVRHILDHFSCLFSGLGREYVDYDARARNPRLEREPVVMRQAIGATKQRLARLGQDGGATPVAVHLRVCSDAAVTMASTLDRELAFLSAHTVHHLSIMAQIARAHGIDVDPAIELAFSTADYRQQLRRGSA
ncbi:MAG: hypothetical protein B7733_18930 [Myxococcales bacterium FL481]|nr:MAG: hypothetical protein B7733_18930 [Myxococcales bacterium FL481]